MSPSQIPLTRFSGYGAGWVNLCLVPVHRDARKSGIETLITGDLRFQRSSDL